MANGTRSSHRAKDEENNNGRVTQNCEKGKAKSHPNVSDTTGLRRSRRETSKKLIPSPSSTGKSEKFEKRALPTPAVKRKSETVDRKKMPSPLRRSGRIRSHSSSSPSDSKSSGSLSSNPKPKKEKSVQQLTFEAKEVDDNEEHDLGNSEIKVKRMDARMYRSFFKSPKNDCLSEPNKIDNSNQEGGNDGGGKIDECSKGSHPDCKEVSENGTLPSEAAKAKVMRVDSVLSRPVIDIVDNNATLGSLVTSNSPTSERDCCREEALQMLASTNPMFDEDLIRNGEKLVPSNRKGITVDTDSNVSATLAKGDNCNSSPNGSPSRLGGNIMGTGGPSSAATYETGLVSEMVQPDFRGDESLQMLASRNSILDEGLVRNDIGHDRGEKLVPSKRKGIPVDMDSDVSASLAKADNCNFAPDDGPSRLVGNITGIDGSCSKRIRLDDNPTVSESCNPSETQLQDGNDIDASMLQKDSPASLLPDAAKNICLICKSEGQLLFCSGKECGRCYHISCLEPPLLHAPLGVWHCHFCVRKKIEFGVYSVSEGVESICDVKEVSFSNVHAQKEFLVKYKGLAHVHNRWVPENQLLLEDPLMLMKFNQKNQTLRLKPEWSLPHRLLQKRALICGKHHDDHMNNHAFDSFNCCYEWLVKWRGLGYEHATWELENAPFLSSPEGQSLIRGYEGRFQRAKRISSCSKLDKKIDRGNSVNKLSQMPGGVSSGFSYNNLDAVNKLREHWHKGQNAIVNDDHERILKVVAFILSLKSDTDQPFLIVSTAASLHSWDDEFYRLDPSIDVVFYNGNKEIRNSIRRLEFYGEGQCVLFQVLIVLPEIIIEDMDVLGGIEWETIILDECQSPTISYFKQIKMLNTRFRVLLFRGQLKDTIVENIEILALLDCQIANEKDGLISNSNNSVVQLKERLSSHIAYRCKSNSFRFVEYWVPVQISHVQLEQYCSILLSNDSILRSSSKNDSIEAVRDVLISTRKCCSHPYVVDLHLFPLLNKGLGPIESIDVGIKASGRFQLLDLMLMELRKNLSRVLILFQNLQSTGGKISIGNCLDDLLDRFGSDSYERIDKGLSSSKKQDAMKKFNDKDNGRFVFLLETCACLPSIKLSSIDTIIIFNSDWNPMNDIRSLQKITFDSQHGLIKIFRLYTPFTIEEKALMLAKQDKTIDINLQNINWSASHKLLMWGASCLFDELRVFHDGEASVSKVKPLFGRPLLEEAMHEFSSLLSQDEDINSNCSTLLKVQHNGGAYCANFPLLGEVKHRLLDEESPQFFWTKLLEGKLFRWKYLNNSSQRCRKKVHHFDGSIDRPVLVSEGVAKKRRKVGNNVVDQPSSKSEAEKLSTGNMAGTSGDLVDRSQGNDVESEQKCIQHGEQRSLHLLLKPEITKLCDVLLLPDNVKCIVDKFLEYVLNNHHVNREPVSILQAFQISLIWTAASFLKHKLDHKASLIHAKQHLNFDFKKEEVDYIYSMLRCLKKIFLYRTGNYNDTGSPKAPESSNRPYSCTVAAREVELFKKDVSKSIKDIRKKCKKHLMKLRLLQEEEKQRLKAAIEDEKTYYDSKYKIELAVIRSCSPKGVMRKEKLKVFNVEYEKRNAELNSQHETRLKDLEDRQLAETQKFQDREAIWVEDVKSWAENELLNINASKELGTGVGKCNGSTNSVTENTPLSDERVGNGATLSLLDNEELLGQLGTVNITDCPKNGAAMNPPASMEQISDGGTANEFLDRESLRPYENGSPVNGSVNITCLNPQHQNSDGVSSSIHDGHIVQEISNEGGEVSAEREVPVETIGRVNYTDFPQNATLRNPLSSMDQVSDRGSLDFTGLDSVVSPGPCQASRSSDGQVTNSLSNPLLEQQTLGVPLSISDRDIPVILPENSHAVADCHNDIEPLTNAVLVDKSTTSQQQEGSPKNMTELSRETPVSRSVNVMNPPGQMQELSSQEFSHDHNTYGEMQNSFEQAELVCSSVPADQSNHVSLVIKHLEQVQQLQSAELPSSHPNSTNFPLATEVEHQPTMVPNQDVMQRDSNSDLDSHSHDVVVHPVSNSDPDSLTPGEVRTQSSEPRNLSTPMEINYHPMQTETHSASRMLPHLCYDPLKNELDRIRKVTEQTMKNYEDMKLQLKSDFEKELEELHRKYDIKFQLIEVEFQQTKKSLDTSLNIVHKNKLLADAFRSKCLVLKASGTSGMQQDSSFAQQLFQLSRQQSAACPPLVTGSSSCGPVTSLQIPSTAAGSQHMLPPIRAGYGASGVFSNVSARLPVINSISSPTANLQAGSEIRAPAPHLQPYRPSTSVPASSSPALLHGMPSQTATSNVSATSPSLPPRPPQSKPTTNDSDHHLGRWPDSADGALVNQSRFGSGSSVLANSSHQATSSDIICLSDED